MQSEFLQILNVWRPLEGDKPGQHCPAGARATLWSKFHPLTTVGVTLQPGREETCWQHQALIANDPHCAGGSGLGASSVPFWAPGQAAAGSARLLGLKARETCRTCHWPTQKFFWVSCPSIRVCERVLSVWAYVTVGVWLWVYKSVYKCVSTCNCVYKCVSMWLCLSDKCVIVWL